MQSTAILREKRTPRLFSRAPLFGSRWTSFYTRCLPETGSINGRTLLLVRTYPSLSVSSVESCTRVELDARLSSGLTDTTPSNLWSGSSSTGIHGTPRNCFDRELNHTMESTNRIRPLVLSRPSNRPKRGLTSRRISLVPTVTKDNAQASASMEEDRIKSSRLPPFWKNS